MNNDPKYLIIFPTDETTRFLDPITVYLTEQVQPDAFTICRPGLSDEAHDECLRLAGLPNYEFIIFLGHGTSNTLHGSRGGCYYNEKFITSKNIRLFANKKIILLSCDSTTMLKKNKKAGFAGAVGFGDLPTDWNDVQSAREAEVEAYKGFTENNIEDFRNCLVEIIKYSLADFIKANASLAVFYNLVLLRVNKRIGRFYTNDRVKNLPLSDVLLKIKDEISFVRS